MTVRETNTRVGKPIPQLVLVSPLTCEVDLGGVDRNVDRVLSLRPL